MALNWYGTQNHPSKSYQCGHCGNPIASNVGYLRGSTEDGGGHETAFIFICHFCFKPTFIGDGMQVPGVRPGEDVEGVDDEGVSAMYKEARDSYSQNAFTATVLCCRKLLMHIAVTKGAKENESFLYYVEYLSEQNYVLPDAKEWVGHIRLKGNEANHEIVIMGKDDADDLLAFITMLMKLIYEFPSKMKRESPDGTIA